MKNSITKITKNTGKKISKFAKKNPTAATIGISGIGIGCCGLITGLVTEHRCKKKLKKLVGDLNKENNQLSDENDKLSEDCINLSKENKNLSDENDKLSEDYINLSKEYDNLLNDHKSLSDAYRALEENTKTHEEKQA